MFLSTEHRRFLLHEQAIGGGVFNTGLNALIAWALFPASDTIPLEGEPSIAGDTIATCFLLPFLICVIVTPLVRKAMAQGKVMPLPWSTADHPLLRWLPRNTWARAALIGLACSLFIAPVAILLLHTLGIEAMARTPFIVGKALFAGALAAAVSPVVALYTLASPQPGVAKQTA